MPVAVKTDATSLRPSAEEDQSLHVNQQVRPRTAVLVDQAPDQAPDPSDDQVVEGPDEDDAADGVAPLMLALGQMATMQAAGALGSREDIQSELDRIAFAVRMFHLKAPDQVMRECGAYGARLTELVVLLHRVEALDRQYTRVRTQQVAQWLTELDRQFKIASRLVEVQRQDLALLGGQP